jgi:preprotein translocase subunit SecG
MDDRQIRIFSWRKPQAGSGFRLLRRALASTIISGWIIDATTGATTLAFGILLTLLLLVGIFMSVIVLLQAGKGGGLAAMGGGGGTAGDTLIGGRQAATLLTKSTWISGGLFLFLALWLSILSSRQAGPEGSVLRQFQAPAAAPTPLLPGAGQEQPAGEGAAPATTPLTPVQPQQQEGGAPPQP